MVGDEKQDRMKHETVGKRPKNQVIQTKVESAMFALTIRPKGTGCQVID
jgi:hypothetical protein